MLSRVYIYTFILLFITNLASANNRYIRVFDIGTVLLLEDRKPISGMYIKNSQPLVDFIGTKGTWINIRTPAGFNAEFIWNNGAIILTNVGSDVNAPTLSTNARKRLLGEILNDDTKLIMCEIEVFHGTISLKAFRDLKFYMGTGFNDNHFLFTGTIANINNALKVIDFTPDGGIDAGILHISFDYADNMYINEAPKILIENSEIPLDTERSSGIIK